MKLLRAFWPLPLVAGGLLWASFPPIDAGWLAPLGWALLFLTMRLRRGARAGRQALVAGLALFVPGLSWIAPLVVPGWLFVALWCAAYEGLFGWLLGKLLARGERPTWTWVLIAPAMHLLLDALRTIVATGFPWLLPGYSGWRNPVLLGSADLLGVHGSTLAILVAGAALAEVAARWLERGRRPFAPLVPAVALWAALAAWAFGKPAIPEEPGPTVLLVQPNLSQQLKEDLVAGAESPSAQDFWDRQVALVRAGRDAAGASGQRIDVVIWGETMVPAVAIRPLTPGRPLVAWSWLTTEVSEQVGRDVAAVAGRAAETLAGIQSARVAGNRFVGKRNTVVHLDSQGRILGHQDKQHLTPGGEYIPLREYIPFRASLESSLEAMAGFLPDMESGEEANLLEVRGPRPSRAGVLICYESIFPELARGMVRRGADFLVNQSNYGWFAGTSEMEQALAMGCFRAAELRRAHVMASNNGISTVIGPDGRPRAYAQDAQGRRADAQAFLVAQVPLASGGGPFSLWGEWAAFALGCLATVASFVLGRARPTP